MAIKYYLLNGKNGEGNALNILVSGKLKRDFIDIAALDLQTMNIPNTKVNEVLQEYNPEIDLTGCFYDASYPHKQTETKTYVPIFNFESEKSKYYINKLKYFAEQRNYKKEHGEKIALDESKYLDDYIRTILYNILSNPQNKLSNYESLMSARLKEIIKERYMNYMYIGTHNYINTKGYLLRNILKNYTELRNLTIEYILYIEGLNTNIRTNIKSKQSWKNNRMTPILEEQKKEENNQYIQMELSDFIEMPSITKILKK